MGNNAAIDVAIGLILMYLLLSLIVTVINEIIAAGADLRAANLKDALTDILDNNTLRQDFYDHGLVASLNKAVEETKGWFGTIVAWVCKLIACPPATNNDPHVSYLSSKTFALALLGSLDTTKPVPEFDDAKTAIQNLPDSNIRDVLLAHLATAEGDFGKLRDNLAKWFDSAMDRVSGLYNRQLKRISFFVGLLLVLMANADTVDVAQSLWKNSALRLEMVQVADAYLKANPDGPKGAAPAPAGVGGPAAPAPPAAAGAATPAPAAAAGGSKAAAPKFGPEIQAIQDDAAQLRKFPVGWSSRSLKSTEDSDVRLVIILKIIGLIMTAIAISLGAPFWFDLLNMFMNLRATGEKPMKAVELDAVDPS
jgi:hypothetical protein